MPIGDPTRSGAQITQPGSYEISLAFSATVSANNQTFSLRGKSAADTTTPISYTGRTSGDTISSTFSFYASITSSDISGGDVYVVFECSGDVGVLTWDHAEIAIKYLGIDNG